MTDSKLAGPDDNERREKINRRLVIFGVLVVLLSFVWHIGSAFIFGEKCNWLQYQCQPNLVNGL